MKIKKGRKRKKMGKKRGGKMKIHLLEDPLKYLLGEKSPVENVKPKGEKGTFIDEQKKEKEVKNDARGI